MLNIEVFEKYRISSDEFNVIIHEKVIVDPTKHPNWERRKAEGASSDKRIDWRIVSYHASVEQALHKLAELKVRESDATTLTELLHDIKRIRREISDVLKRPSIKLFDGYKTARIKRKLTERKAII